jgi:hypothetical protein
MTIQWSKEKAQTKIHTTENSRGHRSRGRMVVGFTTTCTISANHH